MEGGHVPLVVVHRNVLIPTLNPVTPEVGEAGMVTVALPATTVQTPVPTIGAFPLRVAVVTQTV